MPVDVLLAIATLLLSVIGGLIAFIVSRFVRNIGEVKTELKEIVKQLRDMNESLHTIDRDLREKINGVDRRLIQVETEHHRRFKNGTSE